VDEHEPSPELTTEQLDYISDLNIWCFLYANLFML
jgi:hypothetical protein